MVNSFLGYATRIYERPAAGELEVITPGTSGQFFALTARKPSRPKQAA